MKVREFTTTLTRHDDLDGKSNLSASQEVKGKKNDCITTLARSEDDTAELSGFATPDAIVKSSTTDVVKESTVHDTYELSGFDTPEVGKKSLTRKGAYVDLDGFKPVPVRTPTSDMDDTADGLLEGKPKQVTAIAIDSALISKATMGGRMASLELLEWRLGTHCWERYYENRDIVQLHRRDGGIDLMSLLRDFT
ncbi:hypothetical protein ZWY2020_035491 [Hordeum vulgare]|nr:hypothetical protein ZWY2020_035491 [Hordeum vulgare]